MIPSKEVITSENRDFESRIKKVVRENKEMLTLPSKESQIDFRDKISDLITGIVLPNINLTNKLLKESIGDNCPQVICFTNAEGSTSNFYSRYFVQIFIHFPDRELNLLKDPYLLIEAFFSNNTIDLFWSDLENIHFKKSISISVADSNNSFFNHFSTLYLNFIENNLNVISTHYADSEYDFAF